MFHPAVVERRLSNLAADVRETADPAFSFKEYSIAEVADRVETLEKVFDSEEGALTRPLTADEEAFIRHEINRSKGDFLYWATRYAFLKDKHASLVRLAPTAVQELLLKRIAKEEYDALYNKTGDGIILMVLKARQLGVSTISDIIIAHRVFFYANITAMIASDIDDHTENLYGMVGRVLDALPWWMVPRSKDVQRDYRKYNKLISFADQDSVIRFVSSNNMAGGDSGQSKGSMGTGQTLHLAHLSELALWVNPAQIDDALMPSIPRSPRTFAVFESTAKGRGNWWHTSWGLAKRGIGRQKPVFIPWYTDPNTYKVPAPDNWKPSEDSLLHAEAVKNKSSAWVGQTVNLTRDQLYWWEMTRAEYIEKRELSRFLAEYTADDLESFQNTTLGVFPSELIADMKQKAAARNPIYVSVKPKMDISVNT
jgi:hypothetical protein